MTNFVKDGDSGISLTHNFSGNGYAKVYSAPAGLVIDSHRHKIGHDSHLLTGIADVTVCGVKTRHQAPAVLHIEAGEVHKIETVTDVLWACVWPDVGGITDPDQIDHELVQ